MATNSLLLPQVKGPAAQALMTVIKELKNRSPDWNLGLVCGRPELEVLESASTKSRAGAA